MTVLAVAVLALIGTAIAAPQNPFNFNPLSGRRPDPYNSGKSYSYSSYSCSGYSYNSNHPDQGGSYDLSSQNGGPLQGHYNMNGINWNSKNPGSRPPVNLPNNCQGSFGPGNDDLGGNHGQGNDDQSDGDVLKPRSHKLHS